MRNPTARNIRDFITASPRAPKEMDPTSRRFYRAMKRLYAKTPSDRKDRFFRSLSYTMALQRHKAEEAKASVDRLSSTQTTIQSTS